MPRCLDPLDACCLDALDLPFAHNSALNPVRLCASRCSTIVRRLSIDLMRVERPRILPERGGSPVRGDAHRAADDHLANGAASPSASKPPYHPRNTRRILCVFPRYAPSFGTFQHSYSLMPGVRAFMPPQGLLLIAAYLMQRAPNWEVRFVDENLRPARDAEYQWADAVFISGMHVQRQRINEINRKAHQHGKLTVLGGPSVSACPEYYPDVDVLHVGEIGDATDAVMEVIDKGRRGEGAEGPSGKGNGRAANPLNLRPFEPLLLRSQLIFRTRDRLPLTDFPAPAYHLLDLRRYFLGSIQFSSGCPYMCEFCDIPALYGRNPRLKTPQQVCAELDAIVEAGCRSAVYFVDDNFVANRNAAKELLPHLIDWQRSRGYPIRFACEATLNIAQSRDLLAMMREARFDTVFCGIETPEPDALTAMKKKHNLRTPILDSVRTLNEHGMEVVSGIIMGLDTDTEDTPDRILEFINLSKIPMLTINLLYALPKTPLYDRLKAEGRVIDDTGAVEHAQTSAGPQRESNVIFRMPYEQVRAMWLRTISEAYQPANLLERFAHQCEHTYPNRAKVKQRIRPHQVVLGLRMLWRVLIQCGLRNPKRDRRMFWKAAWPLLRTGRIEEVIHIGLVSHHLVTFTRNCAAGQSEACFYADPGVSEANEPRNVATAASAGM